MHVTPHVDQAGRRAVEPPFQPAAIQPFFQPIEDLETGEIVGFEALARLVHDGEILQPASFLAALSDDDRLTLFRVMLSESIAFAKSFSAVRRRVYVSVNVESSLILRADFCALVRDTLATQGFVEKSIVFEILEGDQITDFARMGQSLSRLRRLGILMALDDMGSAYASLINLKRLPIDIIKLDGSFARGLMERPEDLHIVLSVLSLARGLGKRLVVEGVETPEIHDAVRVLGVRHAQGYAIAKPMPRDRITAWLESRRRVSKDRTPRSLLGAYAAHLTVVETCRILMNQPLPISWKEESKDPHTCAIGRFFDRAKTHDTAFGHAHKRFHEVMALYDTDLESWTEGADAFRVALEVELVTIARARVHGHSVIDDDQASTSLRYKCQEA